MPVRPENRLLYPPHWPQVSQAIRKRAQLRCEWEDDLGRCLARQYGVGVWLKMSRGYQFGPISAAWFDQWASEGVKLHGRSNRPTPWTHAEAVDFRERSLARHNGEAVVIVLTVAHLDHNPTNCDSANLRCWCQRHHIAYDQKHHQQTAAATRRAGDPTGDLFHGN